MQPLAHTGVLVGLLATADDVRWPKFRAWFASLYAKLQPLLPAEVGWRHELLSMIKTRSEVGLNGELTVVPATAGAAVYVARRLADASPAADSDLAPQLLSRVKSAVYDDPAQAAFDLAAFPYPTQGAAPTGLPPP